MGRLTNKVAIITGGAGDIGKATAKAFLKEDAKAVVLVDLSNEALEVAQSELSSLGTVETIVADVTKVADVQNYVEQTKKRFGRIDVFFNNAGILGKMNNIIDMPVEEFDQVMNINVKGVFLGLQNVLPVMLAQGKGSVINSSSVAGLMGTPGQPHYGASKHAVVSLTKTAALEVARSGVRVNSVHPNAVASKMGDDLGSGLHDSAGIDSNDLAAAIPVGRFAETDEIAQAVVFLASDDSSYITGHQLLVDGGKGAQ